ncbi:MAG: hypoxanthine phosphoribosyltransferase [Bacteroidales bacterium]|nr:hypoxanthine phosphoribosyltransferase [Bacteroidales bacterium]
MVQVHDKKFKVYIPKEELREIVSRLGKEISADMKGKQPLICPVLTGSFVFAADLVREFDFDAPVSFIKYTSYSGTQSTGTVKVGLPFPTDCTGKDVLIIEDIVDTGISMEFMLNELRKLNPASIKVCTLLFKPSSFQKDFKVDYIGKAIPNDFVLGYGLDYDDYGRLLPDLYVIDE